MEKASSGFAFEEKLANLEALVQKIEAGDLSLEDSLKAFEQGVKMTRECQSALDQAEQKVKMLIEQDGQLSEVPFEQDQAE